MYEGKHIHYSEVDHKPLCSYSPKLCKQRRLNGYAFCIRHVLEDHTAPFRQCEYVAKYKGQRCTNPIPKTQERRFCSSHLQVMGVLPKKERKKKHDALESLAFNITVPSLALNPSGLERLTPSSPAALACLLPLGSYAFCKGVKARKEEGILEKRTSRPVVNPKQKPKDHTTVAVISPVSPSPRHINPPALQTGAPGQVSTGPTSSPPPVSQPPRSSLLCTSAPAQTIRHTLARPVIDSLKPAIQTEPILARRSLPNIPRCGRPVLDPSGPVQQPARRLVQLQRLMEQQRRQHEDLSPSLGLDWSEDSEEDNDRLVHRVSYQYQSLHDKQRESAGVSRGERVAGLCSYLKRRHRHLCREVKGYRRSRRAGHTLCSALLQAAKQDPDCTAQLIQKSRTDISADSSSAGSWAGGSDSGLCRAQVNGEACTHQALPMTRHCLQHILQNSSQQLFSSCTARFADGAQCSIPVFDITHQTPLCEEHAKKMDDFLRGDVSRRTYHHHHQQQQLQCRRLKKTKLPALGRRPKKKGRRGAVRRPQKPIPPALPQAILGMPSVLCLSTQPTGIRSPLTPDLSADEFPDDITSDISDIPHDLEVNQEDFSDVLPRFPDDLQDFDLFEGKASELLPTSEEAEELVRVLQAMGSYSESLACLNSMAELGPLGPVEGSDCRGMEVGVVDLLSARLSAETLSNLELDPSLLPATEDVFPPSPPSPQPPLTPPSSVGHLNDGMHPQGQACLPKTDDPREDLLPLTQDEDISHGSWGVPALPLSDVSSFHSLITSDGLLMSTPLSTPLTTPLSTPLTTPSPPCQPPAALSALPESSLTVPATSSSSSSPSVARSDLLCPGQLKHPLPPLLNHCRIPADLHPHHTAPAATVDRT
ncbi:INO80 complex subunit D-B [Brachyhypopomus gauderio]|uniref:INO80 complex subunit D-B n=1 Tax=Brachyhypopomus gauderio TaxID=698409 RepID=UPI00404320B8